MSLPPELEKERKHIEEICREEGLDFFDTQFYMLSFDELNSVTANIGFPKRYPHWKFGMVYNRYKKQLGHGFGRLYELVINNDPSIAYLLEYNLPVEQKMVIGHVFAHVDFFKNNIAFKNSNRNMLNIMADHGDLIEHYIDDLGLTRVESFIDACLSIENLIDTSLFASGYNSPDESEDSDDCSDSCSSGCGGCSKSNSGDKYRERDYKLPAEDYMDRFINPPEYLEKQRKEERVEKRMKKKNPVKPERDVLGFILQNADKLSSWQRDILSIIRDESYYFAPQGKTKIMNEGWASYWHFHLMTKRQLAGNDGIVDFSKTHAAVLGGGGMQLNPYRLGFQLFNHIEEAWNRGLHGPEFERETNRQKIKDWDTGEMRGREKIFDVRKNCANDVEFIREYMSDYFIREQMFYEFGLDPDDNWYKIVSKDPSQIRNKLVSQLTNGGEPRIYVKDGNFRNSKELLLEHRFDGDFLKPYERSKTLENLFKVWGRPVHIVSFIYDSHEEVLRPMIYSFNGLEHGEAEIKIKVGGE